MILYTIIVQSLMAIPPLITLTLLLIRACGYDPCKKETDIEKEDSEENIPLRTRSILRTQSDKSIGSKSNFSDEISDASDYSTHSKLRQQNLKALQHV